jgi:hypothetical protein
MSLQNEVRIGNWVEILGNSKRLDFFTTIQPSSFSVNIEKTYGPVPLDEDWLQKFGFERIQNAISFKKLEYCIDVREFGLFHFSRIGLATIAKIKHVHQLQNLFFALTQTELQFKNDKPNL